MLITLPARRVNATEQVEVLIAEARDRARRRWRRIGLIVTSFALVAGVSTIAILMWPASRSSVTGPSAPLGAPRTHAGTVTGTISSCAAALSTSPSRQPPPGPAGMVTVMRGHLWYKQIRPGFHEVIVPKRVLASVVAIEHVGAGASFLFHLQPGHYVLLARVREAGHIDQWLPAVAAVTAGKTVRTIIASGCM